MADADADWLPDLAALASLSVAVHYVLGLYGLLGALLLFVLLEHGGSLLAPADDGQERERTPSALEDDASTEGDDELPAAPEQQSSEDDERERDEQSEQLQRRQRVARRRTASLVVSDVGSAAAASREDMEMNSRAPVAFETQLFAGRALFLVRTQPEDPRYAALFAGKRRMFWIQVQGRFKRAPRGPVFLGGELPARIAPGVFTRSVALVIMGLIRRLVGRVSFSFGDNAADELPAVAFPLFQSVDQFVETAEGQTPPELGTADFGESERQRRRRRHTPLGAEKYAVGPTYTFDFHTMYVDLTRWETANLPGGLNAMDLAGFFDSLPLRLVAYDVRAAAAEAAEDSHRQRDKDYLFSFEVKYDKHRRHLHNDYEVMTAEEAMREGGGRPSGGGSSVSGRASTVSGTGLSLMGSEMSTMSTTLSDASSLTEEDPVLAQEHADFLRREHARRLGQLSFSYLCWMEEVDVASDVRRVHYVFAVKDKVGEYDDGEVDGDEELPKPRSRYRLAIVSSYELRDLLQGRHAIKSGKTVEELDKLRFHSRSRIGSYSTISTEARQVVMHLQSLAAEPLPSSALPSYSSDCPSDTETLDGGNDIEDKQTPDDSRLVASQAALYKCLMKRQRLQEPYTAGTKLSPSRIGVNLSRRDREDMGVVFEGVVYRYNAAELLRQEVLLLTKDALLFYRSYASSAEKQVPCSHIIGARAVEMPSNATCRDGSEGTDGAFALQISTFAEEIVLCVGTAPTRDAWVRGVLQYCNTKANFDHALQGEMYIGFAATTALRPANRVELNSRLLFPQLKQQELPSDGATAREGAETISADTIPGAMKLVKRTLRCALHILNNAQHLSVTDVLAFLDNASALRAVDLQLLQDSGSHEEQVAFYLNLYHTVLAHAMIAQGFPRGKGQWSHFLARTCYALSRGPEGEQVTLSLAEIEHVILRARLPRAELPHLSLSSIIAAANEPASRLRNLGLQHPDFRLSLALVLNHMGSEEIVIYEPEHVHDQLNAVLRSLLKRSSAQGYLEMKEDSNTIVLPRVFEWYRHDFGGVARVRAGQHDDDASVIYCVRKLLGFMDGRLQLQVINALGLDDAPLCTKYRSFKYTPKTTLVEDKSFQPSVSEDSAETDTTDFQEDDGTTQL
ncbi:Pleckstrin homology-like domain [Phytophthora cinnamomi]|uniref:Pleckstrin homology-like domain n=1 Tax=Phytophthora cinnamomi TaxID=4785 RepID=UPI00355A0827|nr:Pleckstrin homology-like domain [Phytophthora cinnamomi]